MNITLKKLSNYKFQGLGILKTKSSFSIEDQFGFTKNFTFTHKSNSLTHLYFGGSNFRTKVFLNGHSVGEFIGGYVPFNFEVSNYLVEGDNFLIVQVNNSLTKSTIPTQRTDWWPYGGLIDDDISYLYTKKIH